ncbi:MAG: hypothetical protein PVG66_03860 [Chromatiales bacterium]
MRQPDRRWNKIWLFFSIFVIGLIMAWGQIGKNYMKSYPDEKPRVLLRTEKDCHLKAAPCAAYAPDFALVVRLQQNQGWNTIMLRASGEPLSSVSRLKLSFVASSTDVEPIPLPLRFKQPDIWFSDLQLPDDKKLQWKLRVELQQPARILVAEFPLPQT